jgi:hypothetical protein
MTVMVAIRGATGDATSSIVAISGMRETRSMPLRFTEAIGKERLRGFGCLGADQCARAVCPLL